MPYLPYIILIVKVSKLQYYYSLFDTGKLITTDIFGYKASLQDVQLFHVPLQDAQTLSKWMQNVMFLPFNSIL